MALLNFIMFKKKTSILVTLLFMLLGGVITFYLINKKTNFNSEGNLLLKKNGLSQDAFNNGYLVARLKGSKYTKPILYAEESVESLKYASLKSGVNSIVEKYKNDGTLNSASVYVRDFNFGDWMELNPQETFQPGSLLKVPILISYLKMNEKKPGILNSSVVCDKLSNNLPNQNITTKTIKLGQRYTVKELLHYMIANSDNNATFLLGEYLDMDIYNKTYTDLGLSITNMDSRELFHMSAKEYSTFFKVLFNATYLNSKDSEFAASLLSECDYKDGLIKELPKNITVAHKFGEAGTDDMHELSESGIVYVENNPYLITVMTKGAKLNKLSAVISEISKFVYSKMSGKN